ncbi:hypothetical protein [Leucobacter aridicollis]|uniref:hypothetical protein n=1 Tax=Leucobacter aridicollis TaxID=283878 RepID=UPI0037C8A4A2
MLFSCLMCPEGFGVGGGVTGFWLCVEHALLRLLDELARGLGTSATSLLRFRACPQAFDLVAKILVVLPARLRGLNAYPIRRYADDGDNE